MQISYDMLIFKDFMNMSSPMSLSAFSKSCGIEELSKGIFPYELYNDVRQLFDATKFPDYKCFKSSLGKAFNENYITEIDEVAKCKISTGEWANTR